MTVLARLVSSKAFATPFSLFLTFGTRLELVPINDHFLGFGMFFQRNRNRQASFRTVAFEPLLLLLLTSGIADSTRADLIGVMQEGRASLLRSYDLKLRFSIRIGPT